jgi:hypothetical protein
MKQIIMAIAKEAGNGLAIGIREFLKHSLTITTLMCIVAGLTWTVFVQDGRNKETVHEIKAEVLEMKKEYSAEITELRREVNECNIARQQQAIQIVELRYLLGKLKR